MKHAFEYLSVLLSIVLALAVAHLLGGVARTITARSRIRVYWPSLVWAAVLFITAVQVWWADFKLFDHTGWTFPSFASTLLIPATLYLMAFLILPETQDMKATYAENRVWFFGCWIALLVFSSLQQFLVEGHIHVDADTAAKAVALVVAICAIFLRSDAAQRVLAIFGLAFIVIYVPSLFLKLPQVP